MSRIIDVFFKLQKLDVLLRRQATGTPDQLAAKLSMSRSSWFEMKQRLVEEMGVPIAYDSLRETYYYSQKGRLRIGFEPE